MTQAPELQSALDLIGLGECMVEFWADEPLGSAERLHRAYGGDVLNALVTAARLGSRVGFMTKVGDDPFGPKLLKAWRAEGVDTAHAPLVAGENGVYFISLLAGGEREFTYRRTGSAASTLEPDDLDVSYLASSRTLLVSGITQAISKGARAATLEAARLAKRRSVQVAYDPNYRPGLWNAQGGDREARAAFEEIVPFVDVLLPSCPADAVLVAGEALEPEGALRRFAAAVPFVAMKAGAAGAWLSAHGTRTHLPAVPAEHVVDTTGAGDAWNGAFLHFLLADEQPGKAARLANQVAAKKLAYRGAVPPADFAATLSGNTVPRWQV